MNIQHQDNGQTGKFFIFSADNHIVAEMDYRYRDVQIIDIHHTFVDDSLRGHGVARQLFDAAIAFAQSQHLKIVPTCSYVAKTFERLPELKGLRA